MAEGDNFTISRKWLYRAMAVLLAAIFIGASRGAPPIYLAVGFIGEIILVATVHLSAVIQQYSNRPLGDRRGA